jgi:hypothetical protein
VTISLPAAIVSRMRRLPPFGVFFPCFSPLLARTLAATFGLFLVLEAWRPCYFLTDDNLSAGLPFLTEIGRHLKAGQSPFFSDYLFGGHYYWPRDVMYFSWNPENFIISLIADTPGRFLMLDLVALFNLLLAAAGFLLLGSTLRDDLGLKISDGRLMFYTLSFTYSTFILTCGASWGNFLADQAALPWLALGLWQRTWRPAMALLVLFSLHQVLSGQSAATISNGLILTLFALVLCLYRRSFRPLAFWIAANVATLLLILPILRPALDGFLHSQRSGGLSLDLLSRFAMPAPLFPISYLFGNFFEMAAWFGGIHRPTLIPFPRIPTLLACAAAWCLFPAVLNLRRWTLLEGSCAGLVLLLAILVVRPIGISEAMLHVQILRSMRWPFREIMQLLFFLHVFLVLRPAAGSFAFQNRVAWISLVLFVLPLFYSWPLSLNPLLADRQAVFSGQGDRFWTQVKLHLRPGDKIATVIDPDVWLHSQNEMPYSLTGTADFPTYFRVPAISGYSQTPPLDQLPIPLKPYYWFGAYAPDQVPALTKDHPEIRIITVKSTDPLTLQLSAPAGGPPIDLTPLLSR